ncbi:MAG: prepilin peptidase [Nitrospirales bacterium]|nr:A24 family peptidase [Nitrospirales bacterium]
MMTAVLLVGLAIALVLAAYIDVREGRIPNWLTFSLAGFGTVVNTADQGWAGFLNSIEGVSLGILCLIFFYIKGGMGAGDVKLLGAIGGVMGPYLVVYVFGFAAILGGLYSLVMLMAQGGFRYTWDRVVLLLQTLQCTKSVLVAPTPGPQEPKLRYALVLGLGTVLTQTLIIYGLL